MIFLLLISTCSPNSCSSNRFQVTERDDLLVTVCSSLVLSVSSRSLTRASHMKVKGETRRECQNLRTFCRNIRCKMGKYCLLFHCCMKFQGTCAWCVGRLMKCYCDVDWAHHQLDAGRTGGASSLWQLLLHHTEAAAGVKLSVPLWADPNARIYSGHKSASEWTRQRSVHQEQPQKCFSLMSIKLEHFLHPNERKTRNSKSPRKALCQ